MLSALDEPELHSKVLVCEYIIRNVQIQLKEKLSWAADWPVWWGH